MDLDLSVITDQSVDRFIMFIFYTNVFIMFYYCNSTLQDEKRVQNSVVLCLQTDLTFRFDIMCRHWQATIFVSILVFNSCALLVY